MEREKFEDTVEGVVRGTVRFDDIQKFILILIHAEVGSLRGRAG